MMIGGVRIPHNKALKAHSDGDVALHAVCDALLGSMALGDLGKFFPDDDPEFKGVDSRELLRKVMEFVAARGASVNNVDVTIVAQKPKMAPHIDAMRQNIAEDLGIALNQSSVKATTSEKLGFMGREEGIAAYASVLVTEKQ